MSLTRFAIALLVTFPASATWVVAQRDAPPAAARAVYIDDEVHEVGSRTGDIKPKDLKKRLAILLDAKAPRNYREMARAALEAAPKCK